MMEKPLFFLAGAIVFEVTWAVALKVSQGFTLLWPSLVTIVAYILSLLCLSFASKDLHIGTVYAIWTGTGAALVAVLGVLVFREPLGIGRAIGLLLVVAGAAVLLGLEHEPA